MQLSGLLHAQNRLVLDRQFVYPSEQLGYTYINEHQDITNLVYLAIVDLQSQEIVDFVFHSLEDKIIEGGITLDKNLVPGYYALLAAKYGSKEIHYEQFWVRDPLWRALGGQQMMVSELGDSLKIHGRVSVPNTQVSIFMTTVSVLNDTSSISLNEAGEFEVFLAKDSILNKDMPVWALVELRNENEQLAIQRFPVHWPEEAQNVPETLAADWLSILDDQILVNVSEVGEFSIESMDELIIIEDPIFPEDSLTFNRADLPTGKLKLRFQPISDDRASSEELWNYPQIAKEEDNRRIVIQSGEELVLDLPELNNPWVSLGNHFLSVKMDMEARVLEERYTGTLLMTDSLDSTLDMVTMQSSDPDKLRANRTVLFTNGEYLLNFTTDEKGAFSISRSEAPMFGFEEGRLRYREEERQVRLEPSYPAIEHIKEQIPLLLSAMHPKIIEQDALLSSRAIEVDQSMGDDEWTIDLDAVVVQGQNMEERIEEVLNDPFALDWLNEDWVCQHGVLNGGGIDIPDWADGPCEPIYGNHPSVEDRIPLHLIYDESFISLRRSMLGPRNRKMAQLLRGQIIIGGIVVKRTEQSRRFFQQLEGVVKHFSKVIKSYSWDPADYLDQIGSVKLPKQNKLLLAEDGLSISNGQKVWLPYSVNPSLKLKAPNLPGTYTLDLRYWDLHHEISSSISYEVVVR